MSREKVTIMNEFICRHINEAYQKLQVLLVVGHSLSWHVLKPGTPEHRNTGTPEHPGTPEHRNTPEHPGTPRNTPEHPGTPRNTGTVGKKPGTPIFMVLFCCPITDHVKNKLSMYLFTT